MVSNRFLKIRYLPVVTHRTSIILTRHNSQFSKVVTFKSSANVPTQLDCIINLDGKETSVPVSPSTALSSFLQQVVEKTGSKEGALLVNAIRFDIPSLDEGKLVFSDLVGKSVDVELDLVRYPVNEGTRMNLKGTMTKKRSLAATSLLMVGGATAALVASLTLFNYIIPEEHKRFNQ
jgi:hypothetical protein